MSFAKTSVRHLIRRIGASLLRGFQEFGATWHQWDYGIFGPMIPFPPETEERTDR
ncbi:hypothetical protein AB0C27_09430 [Nonomuraea sp. NPDC048882]|uniref:hypothetical protein n=1 Tax=unclassified Nonomuraea TaxID=2593643 RepID=UPI000A7EED41